MNLVDVLDDSLGQNQHISNQVEKEIDSLICQLRSCRDLVSQSIKELDFFFFFLRSHYQST